MENTSSKNVTMMVKNHLFPSSLMTKLLCFCFPKHLIKIKGRRFCFSTQIRERSPWGKNTKTPKGFLWRYQHHLNMICWLRGTAPADTAVLKTTHPFFWGVQTKGIMIPLWHHGQPALPHVHTSSSVFSNHCVSLAQRHEIQIQAHGT